MDIERQVKQHGRSLVLVIPPDLCKHLDIKKDSNIVIRPEKRSHGKFASFWKKKETDNIFEKVNVEVNKGQNEDTRTTQESEIYKN